MPIIELTAEEIGKGSEATLVAVAAVMLWPDDATARDQYLRSYQAEQLRKTAAAIQPGTPIGPRFAETIELVRTAPRVDELEGPAKRRYEAGVIVGRVIGEALGAVAGTSLHTIKARVLARLPVDRKTKRAGQRTVATLDKLMWNPLRPAAHLWAAHCQYAQQTGSIALPCDGNALPYFFAVAAVFLTAAGSHYPPRSSVPLLDAATAWRPTPGLRLPELDPTLH